METLWILPRNGLPALYGLANKELEWLYDDSEENYRKRGGHPIYGEHDIIYRFNSRGYRCPEFDAQADIRIVAVGCSYVQGIALPQHALFHEAFAERLRGQTGRSVVVWNLGMPGASNDYICRTLYLAVPWLDPHVVLINFTHGARREYLTAQNERFGYSPTGVPRDPARRELHDHFAALSSAYDDQLNFFRNYKALESLLGSRPWLYSHANPQDFNRITGHLDLVRYVGRVPTLDKARDLGHPGPRSHEALAELYWDRFMAIGWLNALQSDFMARGGVT